jgi:hypothetical protein
VYGMRRKRVFGQVDENREKKRAPKRERCVTNDIKYETRFGLKFGPAAASKSENGARRPRRVQPRRTGERNREKYF